MKWGGGPLPKLLPTRVFRQLKLFPPAIYVVKTFLQWIDLLYDRYGSCRLRRMKNRKPHLTEENRNTVWKSYLKMTLYFPMSMLWKIARAIGISDAEDSALLMEAIKQLMNHCPPIAGNITTGGSTDQSRRRQKKRNDVSFNSAVQISNRLHIHRFLSYPCRS